MFNRVAVVVRAIAKFWNLEPGTWNQHLGWRAKPAPGLYDGTSAREKWFSIILADLAIVDFENCFHMSHQNL
jgi:hypothetical protein